MTRDKLLEAYIGTYENDRSLQVAYELYVQQEGRNGALAVEAYESWLAAICNQMIEDHDAKTHLRIYLEWNGIIGYTETIFAIARGEENA